MRCVVQSSQLTIYLEGMEQLWALKRRVQIPRFAISEVNYEPDTPVMQDFQGHLRLLGTALPMNFVAGTYKKDDEREFWYVRLKQPGILTVELKSGTARYDRVRITCDADTAQMITEWWRVPAITPA